MRNPQMIRVAILAILAISASIGYWEYLDLYRVERTEIRVQEETYTDEVFAKGSISGLLAGAYKGWVSISLDASREVRVDFQEAIMHNGASYETVETHITDHIANMTFKGPEYVAVEVGMLEDYDEVTVQSMRIVGPVERTYRPHGDIAVTIGYFSVLSWLAAGSLVALEASWEIYKRLGTGGRRSSR